MIVIVDERELVTDGYCSMFGREGVASAGFAANEFDDWVSSAPDADLKSVQAFLIGDCPQERISPRQIRGRTGAPVIALSDHHSLENTLRLFESGVDDVLRKPVHIREILARISAIRRRSTDEAGFTQIGDMKISTLVKALAPFFLAEVCVIVLIILIPGLSSWLPGLFH